MGTNGMSQAELAEATNAAAVDLERTRRNVAALGSALRAAHLTGSPTLARAVQAQVNLYEAIETEFGLLTSSAAADRMGSRAVARRNAATAARAEGRLLALRRGRYLLYPGFQFDAEGIRPVIADLRAVAEEHEWDEPSLIEWLVSPTSDGPTGRGGRVDTRTRSHNEAPDRSIAATPRFSAGSGCAA